MSEREITAPVLPGEILAEKYRIERVLGRGGMGVVLAATHLQLEERVAIKFLLGGQDGPQQRERFFREARASAKIKSEHAVKVYDVGALPTGEPYMVMEYLEGATLADVLRDDRALSPARTANYLLQVCEALIEAHGLGIVHRDLKPENLFLTMRRDGDPCVKVLDFGISKMGGRSAMTRTSAMMGSPIYMSPEQLESSRDVDLRADIWSLGIILYELLCGVPPFMADTLPQLVVQIRERTAPRLRQACPEAPEALEAVVARCLERDPAARFTDVGELAAALEPFVDARARAETEARVGRIGRVKQRTSSPDLERSVPTSGELTPAPGASADAHGVTLHASPQSPRHASSSSGSSAVSAAALASPEASPAIAEMGHDASGPPGLNGTALTWGTSGSSTRSGVARYGLAAAVAVLALAGATALALRSSPSSPVAVGAAPSVGQGERSPGGSAPPSGAPLSAAPSVPSAVLAPEVERAPSPSARARPPTPRGTGTALTKAPPTAFVPDDRK